MKCAVLDIDGVFLKGGKVLNGAKSAMSKLLHHNIPYVFVTNGGGVLEDRKANDLSKKLGIPVSSDQIVMCHTPWKELAPMYANSRVYISGHRRCIDIAKSYGFSKAVGMDTILSEHKDIHPLITGIDAKESASKDIERTEAIFVFHDPYQWEVEMQLMSDLLLTNGLHAYSIDPNSLSTIPFYCSNADLVYSTEYPLPRFTQGAFAETFKYLFDKTAQPRRLHINYYGKPFPAQYEYAMKLLQIQFAQKLSVVPESVTYFGIGDNPKSDIRGARNMGKCWRSILVRTGIFQSEKENDEEDPADYVCQNIDDAIDIILNFKV